MYTYPSHPLAVGDGSAIQSPAEERERFLAIVRCSLVKSCSRTVFDGTLKKGSVRGLQKGKRGKVKHVEIFGVLFKGTDLRERLNGPI